jgi:putative membrane protein insertion efficiency factor
MQIARNIALWLLRGYKLVISPWLPASCRYVPTCSEYAMEAIEHFGVLRGSMMGLGRILRCHPFAQSGYDPVVRDGVSASEPRCKGWTADQIHDHGCRAN